MLVNKTYIFIFDYYFTYRYQKDENSKNDTLFLDKQGNKNCLYNFSGKLVNILRGLFPNSLKSLKIDCYELTDLIIHPRGDYQFDV